MNAIRHCGGAPPGLHGVARGLGRDDLPQTALVSTLQLLPYEALRSLSARRGCPTTTAAAACSESAKAAPRRYDEDDEKEGRMPGGQRVQCQQQ